MIRFLYITFGIIAWLGFYSPLWCQNVGINNANPLAPLALSNNFGPKIVFWGGDALQPNYGLGMNDKQFQFYSDMDFTSIAFGTGRSAAFNEMLRIQGNGRVGIYNTDPQQILDVTGRMRINPYDSVYRDPYTQLWETVYRPGYIYFNNANNSASVFKATATAVYGNFSEYTFSDFGFYSLAKNKLRFGCNETGTLIINGQTGTAGQVLRSQEYYGEAIWQNPRTTAMVTQSNTANAASAYVISTTPVNMLLYRNFDISIADANNYQVSSGTRMLVKFSVNAFAFPCVCAASVFDIQIRDNGNVLRSFRYTLSNGANNYVNGSAVITVPAGTHQLTLGAVLISGPNVTVSGGDTYASANMVVNIIPSN